MISASLSLIQAQNSCLMHAMMSVQEVEALKEQSRAMKDEANRAGGSPDQLVERLEEMEEEKHELEQKLQTAKGELVALTNQMEMLQDSHKAATVKAEGDLHRAQERVKVKIRHHLLRGCRDLKQW